MITALTRKTSAIVFTPYWPRKHVFLIKSTQSQFAVILCGKLLYSVVFVLIVVSSVPTNEPSSLHVIRELSEMSLVSPPQSTTYDASTASRGELVAEAHNNLPYIRSVFVDSCQGKKRALDFSR